MNAPAASRAMYGLLAEFDDTSALVAAAHELRRRGYRRIEGYTPFPVEGLAEAVGFERTRLPLVVLIGAVLGGVAGFALQWWVSVVAYPLNIGGRPLNSWPSFVPVTFELTILGGALFAVLGMLGLNGLPRPHHPLFAMDGFERATTDGYFLCVEADDPEYHETSTRQLLEQLGAKQVWDVPAQ
jgi:hypothetical protein